MRNVPPSSHLMPVDGPFRATLLCANLPLDPVLTVPSFCSSGAAIAMQFRPDQRMVRRPLSLTGADRPATG